jgi:transposase
VARTFSKLGMMDLFKKEIVMHVEAHEPLEQLQELADRQKRTREHRRFRAVVLARQGHTADQIADILDCARRPVQRWIARYNHGGVQALLEGRHAGRTPRLKPDREPAFRRRVEAGPDPAADGTCAFHGGDFQRILEREFGVLMGLGGVYALLHRLGYSRLCPRPRHPETDPAAQAEFKKNG